MVQRRLLPPTLPFYKRQVAILSLLPYDSEVFFGLESPDEEVRIL